MRVAAILKAKGRAVVTARPDATVSEVAAKLAARKIGALVVVGDGGAVSGIFSERDLVRIVADKGSSVMQQPVSSFMTKDVITCNEDATLEELMEKMTKGHFRHLPVVENGALVGLISIGDVVKYHLADITLEVTAMKNYLATG